MNDWHIGKSGCEDQAEKNGKNPTEDQKYSWHPGTDKPDTGSRGVFFKMNPPEQERFQGPFWRICGVCYLGLVAMWR